MPLLNPDGTPNYGGKETFTNPYYNERTIDIFRKAGEAWGRSRDETILRVIEDHLGVTPTTPFRAGDVVYHAPTKEKWLLAADERDGEVVCAGWPESIAKAKDCSLVTAAGDEMRKKILTDVVAGCGDQMRGSWARQDLLK